MMSLYMGIDIGSRTSKAVLIRDGAVVASSIMATGTNHQLAAEAVRRELLLRSGVSSQDAVFVVATGNAAGVGFSDEAVSDIVCCARGINHVFPNVRTVIDVQAQSSRVIRLSGKGHIVNFVVSEKCAAGCGFFLEIIASVLRLDISEIGPLSLKSEKPVTFSTSCAVFGETEAISRVAEGATSGNILAGVHNGMAEKMSSLVNRVGIEEPCAVSGGGALDIGLIKSLEATLSVRLLVPQQPQLVTALGAALVAAERSAGR
jgi:predicted CoA-substrate-specific enzyme activase